MTTILDVVKPGVVTGEDVQKVFAICKENKFALPAVNVISTDTINSVLEAAAKVKSPVVIQFSNGGAAFVAGKGLKLDGQGCSIVGAISGAHHVHAMAELYGVPVILITQLRNCCHGLTACWMLVKNILLRTVSLCSARICWIYQKKVWKKTSQPALNIWSACPKWA
jgi:fructose-bisphosphate aldolase class II